MQVLYWEMKKKVEGERSHVDMRHREHSRVVVVGRKAMVLLLPAAISSLRIPLFVNIRTKLKMNVYSSSLNDEYEEAVLGFAEGGDNPRRGEERKIRKIG